MLNEVPHDSVKPDSAVAADHWRPSTMDTADDVEWVPPLHETMTFQLPAAGVCEAAVKKERLPFANSVSTSLPPITKRSPLGAGCRAPRVFGTEPAPRVFSTDPADDPRSTSKNWLKSVIERENEAMPASRKDAVNLGETVDVMLAQACEEAADQSLNRDERLERERRVLESSLNELVRQVGTHCAERGLLLDRLCYAYRASFGALPEAHSRLQRRCRNLESRLGLVEERREQLTLEVADERAIKAELSINLRVMKLAMLQAEHSIAHRT